MHVFGQVALSREEDGGGAGRTGVVCGQCGQELRLSLSEQDREFEALALREGYKQVRAMARWMESWAQTRAAALLAVAALISRSIG